MPPENETPDFELVEKIKLDDKEAFQIVYYRYYQKLMNFAWNRTGSIDSSGEHVQELFTRIWIKRNQLNPDKSLKSYLYTSLNNIIINHNKLFFTRSKSIDYVAADNFLKTEVDRDLQIDIKEAISRLPEKEKTVYLMSRLDRFSYTEIAEIFNISVKTVEKRMSKALKLLRNYLVRNKPGGG